MQISARNALAGEITALNTGGVNTEVRLRLAGGQALVAVVTQASAQALGLAVGGRALALVKAPWVTVVAGHGPLPGCPGEPLAGVVAALRGSGVSVEVLIDLPDGAQLCAVVTQQAVQALGLVPGAPVRALIAPSQVVLAV